MDASLAPFMPAPSSHPHTQFEEHYGFGQIAGVDEAGCGPWAGPVVAASVMIYPSLLSHAFISHVTDSKQLSPQKREDLVRQLKEIAFLSPSPLIWHVGMASVEEIDRLNIRNANFLAMTRALKGLTQKPQIILVDGTGGLKADVPVIPLVKGDQQCLSIAIASLFAKVARDHLMNELHQEYPAYDWENNKGYGTKRHQEALRHYGPTLHHRMSYKPLQAFRGEVV